MGNNPRPICPVCGQRARRTKTQFGIRHDCCGLWSWGNKALVDRETHAARQLAHSYFDKLWQSGRMRRGDAYRALSDASGWPESDCHMSHMPKERAVLVPDFVRQIWRGLMARAA